MAHRYGHPVGSPVLAARFDGDATDSSGNGNNGTASNVTYVTSLLSEDTGQAASFNGTSSKVDFGSTLAIVGHVTAAASVQVHAWPTGSDIGCIVGKGYNGDDGGWYFDIRSGPTINYGCFIGGTGNIGGAYSWTTGALDTTYRIAVRYDGTAWSLWINGIKVHSTTSAQGAPAASGAKTLVGAYDVSGTAGRFFNGKIDEVDVDASNLTDAQLVDDWLKTSRPAALQRAQTDFSALKRGLFVVWGMPTYAGNEIGDGTETVNTFAPTTAPGTIVDNWIAGALAFGAKYLTLVTKHPDGFCLWPSDTTTHDIAATTYYSSNSSPDFVRLFCDKCRAAGLLPFLYFSIWDRNWEAAHPGFTGADYLAFAQSQVTELLTRYGRIHGIWTDAWAWQITVANGYASAPYTFIDYASFYGTIKALQPECLLLENNHLHTLTNSDVDLYEVPVDGTVGATNILPAEITDTIRVDRKWFDDSSPGATLSPAILAAAIKLANDRGANYLFDPPIGRSGLIDPSYFDVMRALGGLAPTRRGVGGTASRRGM
jgi:alpha-L-fucosidase